MVPEAAKIFSASLAARTGAAKIAEIDQYLADAHVGKRHALLVAKHDRECTCIRERQQRSVVLVRLMEDDAAQVARHRKL